MSTDLEYLEELLTEVKLNPPAIVDSQNDIITTDEIGKQHMHICTNSSYFSTFFV